MKKTLIALVLVGTLASAAAFAGEMIPNRLATAKVGDWVIYQLPDGYTQKHMVVERSGEGPDANIVIRADDILDGKVVGTHEITELAGEDLAPMPATREPGAVATTRLEQVTVKGQVYPATAIDVKKGNDLIRTWYVSREIPVYGLIKRVEVKGSEPSFEIIDFSGN